MDLVIVTERELARSGSRLAAAIAPIAKATVWTESEAARKGELPEGRAILFLGEVAAGRALLARTPAAYSQHGIRWCVDGQKAAIHAEKTSALSDSTNDMAWELDRIRKQGEAARSRLGRVPKKNEVNGSFLASRFLDPDLEVPKETVVSNAVSFDLDRLLWERQYTVGIATFLRDGLEPLLGRS